MILGKLIFPEIDYVEHVHPQAWQGPSSTDKESAGHKYEMTWVPFPTQPLINHMNWTILTS